MKRDQKIFLLKNILRRLRNLCQKEQIKEIQFLSKESLLKLLYEL